jgi:hypothetical protein
LPLRPAPAIKFESRNPKLETNSKFQCSKVQNRNPATHGFGHLNLDHWILPFDVAQGGEPFDVAQDPEVLEGLVEPFRISCFGFRIFDFQADCEGVTREVTTNVPPD